MTEEYKFNQKLDEEVRAAVFVDCFEKDVESWFTRDICGCDKCIDSFIEEWPGAEKRDIEFQTSYMDIKTFFSGSKRLQRGFSEQDLEKYVGNIKCPRCDESFTISTCFYPYELPIEDLREFIWEVQDLSVIIRSTPFLALTHPYAQKVLEEIKSIFETTAEKKITQSLFRARTKNNSSNVTKSFFNPPPAELTSEGRFNHVGMPVLYVASNKDTCISEMSTEECNLAICELVLPDSYKLLDLTLNGIYDETSILHAISLSPLFLAPKKNTGWNSPEYIFTRFISDCAKAAGFDAISYPSAKARTGYNIVFLMPEKINIESCVINIF